MPHVLTNATRYDIHPKVIVLPSESRPEITHLISHVSYCCTYQRIYPMQLPNYFSSSQLEEALRNTPVMTNVI